MARRGLRPAAALAACLMVLGCDRLAALTAQPALTAQIALTAQPALTTAAPPIRTEEYGAPARVLPAATLDHAACGAVEAREFVGGHFTALAEMSLRGQMRILWPGQRGTDDVQPLRLNVQVSDSGMIRRVFCG